jgi:uncharacterized protein (TIGR00369 family)
MHSDGNQKRAAVPKASLTTAESEMTLSPQGSLSLSSEEYMEIIVSEMEKRIAASFSTQGLMSTLGAELVSVAPGEVRIALTLRPELSQQRGYLHAGAIASVVDSACGYATMTLVPVGYDVLTVEFKVNFMRPASADRFIAIGKVIKPGKTLAVCQGEVIGERGGGQETVAIMQATMISVAVNP